MNGVSAEIGRAGPPFGPFVHGVRPAAIALLAIYSAIVLLFRDRLEQDCGCSQTSRRTIVIFAGSVAAAFLAWLLGLAWQVWKDSTPRSRRVSWRRQAGHFLAALVPWSMTVLGILLLTVPSQTADLLAGLHGDIWYEFTPALMPFAAGTWAWGSATWFCGRWAVDVASRDSRRPEEWLATWNPRLMALMTGFAVIWIATKAAGLCSLATIAASGVAAGVFLLAFFRRRFFRRYGATLLGRLAGGARLPPADRPAGKGRWGQFADDLRMAPGGLILAVPILGVSVLVIAAFAISPESGLTQLLKAPGTVLLGIAGLTLLATCARLMERRIVRWPLLPASLVFTSLLGFAHVGVNHDIRTIPEKDRDPKAAILPAMSLSEAAKSWLEECGVHLLDKTSNEVRVVLVSTAGGASRAAMWTFHALHELEEIDPQFPRRVFAVSAVSGGGLGATVWSSLLARQDFDCKPAIERGSAGFRRDAGHAMLSHDFLAPVLAGWIARDVPLGVFPLNGLLRPLGINIPDRAAVLEHAWEAAWARIATDKPAIMASDFMTLWGEKFNRPLLFLNGTIVQSGLPAVTAPVSLTMADGKPDPDLPATYDARGLLGAPVRVSTAALNAARFPVVSPQGDIRVWRCPDGKLAHKAECPGQKGDPEAVIVSVVDGGYFDNIGGGTTMRISEALRAAFPHAKGFPEKATMRIMTVAISSDPDRFIDAATRRWIDAKAIQDGKTFDLVNQLMRCTGPPVTLAVSTEGGGNALNGEIAPVAAIVATQSGHTAARMTELNQRFCAAKQPAEAPSDYIVLSLCPVSEHPVTDQPVEKQNVKPVTLPLNWVLPPATQSFFARGNGDSHRLATLCGNVEELEAYRRWAKP